MAGLYFKTGIIVPPKEGEDYEIEKRVFIGHYGGVPGCRQCEIYFDLKPDDVYGIKEKSQQEIKKPEKCPVCGGNKLQVRSWWWDIHPETYQDLVANGFQIEDDENNPYSLEEFQKLLKSCCVHHFSNRPKGEMRDDDTYDSWENIEELKKEIVQYTESIKGQSI